VQTAYKHMACIVHSTKLTKCLDLNEIWQVARVITQGLAYQVSAYFTLAYVPALRAGITFPFKNVIVHNYVYAIC